MSWGLGSRARSVERRGPSCGSRLWFGGVLAKAVDCRLTQNHNHFIRCKKEGVTSTP